LKNTSTYEVRKYGGEEMWTRYVMRGREGRTEGRRDGGREYVACPEEVAELVGLKER